MNQWPAAWLLRKISMIPRLRTVALKLALKVEGNQFYSLTGRWILASHYGVRIGAYSYGDCFVPGIFPSGVNIGRYVSIGPGVRVFMRNHPLDRLSTHPFFYNSQLDWVTHDMIDSGFLEIGHDAWIGAGATILRGCSKIGVGAVVGAGSVVTRNVPDFAIAAGNPARIIRMRFAPETCHLILASCWWEKSVAECAMHLSAMAERINDIPHHPLLHNYVSADALPARISEQ